jgi:hypothetical protein
MLLGNIIFKERFAYLDCEDSNGYSLEVISTPEDNKWDVNLYGVLYDLIHLTDEQFNMICKYVESEFNEYHSNNSAFTDDDKEHFNSLIN